MLQGVAVRWIVSDPNGDFSRRVAFGVWEDGILETSSSAFRLSSSTVLTSAWLLTNDFETKVQVSFEDQLVPARIVRVLNINTPSLESLASRGFRFGWSHTDVVSSDAAGRFALLELNDSPASSLNGKYFEVDSFPIVFPQPGLSIRFVSQHFHSMCPASFRDLDVESQIITCAIDGLCIIDQSVALPGCEGSVVSHRQHPVAILSVPIRFPDRHSHPVPFGILAFSFQRIAQALMTTATLTPPPTPVESSQHPVCRIITTYSWGTAVILFQRGSRAALLTNQHVLGPTDSSDALRISFIASHNHLTRMYIQQIIRSSEHCQQRARHLDWALVLVDSRIQLPCVKLPRRIEVLMERSIDTVVSEISTISSSSAVEFRSLYSESISRDSVDTVGFAAFPPTLQFSPTVTRGIISKILEAVDSGSQPKPMACLILTTAAVYAGQSGGALLCRDQLIGLVSANVTRSTAPLHLIFEGDGSQSNPPKPEQKDYPSIVLPRLNLSIPITLLCGPIAAARLLVDQSQVGLVDNVNHSTELIKRLLELPSIILSGVDWVSLWSFERHDPISRL